jgi:uncharacterized protein (DUF1778 family)
MKPDTRSVWIGGIRVTEKEREYFSEAARKAGMTRSVFIRDVLKRAAAQRLRDDDRSAEIPQIDSPRERAKRLRAQERDR